MNVFALLTPRTTLRCRTAIVFGGLVLSLAASRRSSSAAEDAPSWRAGKDFHRQLDARLGFQWESSPIRQGLRGLATNQRVAIWLDRRVDPDHEMDLLVDDATLDEALRRIASAIGGGVSYVGSVAYLGSSPVTAKLATLAALRRDEVKRLPTVARRRFASQSTWTWQELSTPRELLSQLAEQAGAKVMNIDRIPHDLWPSGDFPAMVLTDRMTLLLAGFDLTFEIARDGSAIRLTPMPAEVAMQRSYSPRGSLNAAATTIATAFPDVGIKKAGARLAITGTFEQHQSIGRLIRGEPIRRARTTAGSKRFDLRVDNQTIAAIINAVAQRAMLEVQAAPAIQAKLQQRISLDVKQLTLDQLLERALMSVDVVYRIADGVLELRSR